MEQASVAAAEGGFATIDALVATTLLAVTILMATAALHTAVRASGAALEARRAATLLEDLLRTDTDSVLVLRGDTADFRWSLALGGPSPTLGAAARCRRQVEIEASSGRRYLATTDRICPSKVDGA